MMNSRSLRGGDPLALHTLLEVHTRCNGRRRGPTIETLKRAEGPQGAAAGLRVPRPKSLLQVLRPFWGFPKSLATLRLQIVV